MPTTSSRRPAVKKTAAAHDAAEVLSGVVLDSSRPVPEIKRFPVFAIDGVQYYAPVRPPARISLQMLWLARHEGDAVAVAYLLEEMLGADGYQALMAFDGLTQDDLDRIITLLREAADGSSIAGPKGRLRIA